MISHTELLERLSYDPETGVFRWKECQSRRRIEAGEIAGYVTPQGYRRIKFGKHVFFAHRLAWLYAHGRLPVGEIDHRNCEKDDNRIANLRDATRQQNAANQHAHANNAVGLKGVHRVKGSRRYRAQIKVGGKEIIVGRFDSADEASAAYAIAAQQHFGEFARAA